MEDRKKIKEEILSLIKSSSPHLLNYCDIEIIDSSYIDDILVEEIDKGNPGMPLTDELFFECISNSPDYLAYEPFRAKIREWKKRLDDAAFGLTISNDEKKQLEKNLQDVGKALVKQIDYRGRPFKRNNNRLIMEFQDLLEILAPFIAETKKTTSPKAQERLFKDRYPGFPSFKFEKKYRTTKSLAKNLLAERNGMHRTDLEKLVSKYKKRQPI